MHGSVTLRIDAPPEEVWALVSDVTNTGRFSPETIEAEWLEGATEPGLVRGSGGTCFETVDRRRIGRTAG